MVLDLTEIIIISGRKNLFFFSYIAVVTDKY